MDHNRRSRLATYVNQQFFIQVNDTTADQTATAIGYLDWNNTKLFARINGDNFETSVKDDFVAATAAKQLQFKDDTGNNKFVQLETQPRHILPFNTKLPVARSFSSPNGNYSLRVTNAALELRNTSSNQVVWSSMDFAAAKNGLTLMQTNSEFELRMTAMPGQTVKFADLGSFLSVRDNGNLLIYRRDGLAVWQSNTIGR